MRAIVLARETGSPSTITADAQDALPQRQPAPPYDRPGTFEYDRVCLERLAWRSAYRRSQLDAVERLNRWHHMGEKTQENDCFHASTSRSFCETNHPPLGDSRRSHTTITAAPKLQTVTPLPVQLVRSSCSRGGGVVSPRG